MLTLPLHIGTKRDASMALRAGAILYGTIDRVGSLCAMLLLGVLLASGCVAPDDPTQLSGPGVEILQPAADITVDKELTVALAIGGTPSQVLLKFRDIKTFTIAEFMIAPPYQQMFDMTDFANDQFTLTATAMIDGIMYQSSESRTVSVDHSAPVIVSQSGGYGAPFVVTFSKPIVAGDLSRVELYVNNYPYQSGKLLEPDGQPLRGTIQIQGATLTVTPDVPPLAPCDVFMVVQPPFTDGCDRKPLSGPYGTLAGSARAGGGARLRRF